jgi:hypothetical protein
MADGEQYPRCGTALVMHRSFSTRVRFGFGPKELRLFSLSIRAGDLRGVRQRGSAICVAQNASDV